MAESGDITNCGSSGSSESNGNGNSKLSLSSIPSIDRSDEDTQPTFSESTQSEPNRPNINTVMSSKLTSNISVSQPNLAHTPPPPEALQSAQPVSNLAHTPPPPSPAPQSKSEVLASRARTSPHTLTSNVLSGALYVTRATDCSDATTSDPRKSSYSVGCNRSSFDASCQEIGNYSTYGSSPSSTNGVYCAIGALYNTNHPSSGIYSGSSSVTSFHVQSGPPPVPPPPLVDSRSPAEYCHFREHSINSFREFYDKSSLNQFMSPSPKLSNRDIEMNKMPSIYGGSFTGPGPNYGGLTEIFSDPVEEMGGERVVWEYHNVQLIRVPTYGFGIAVSGGRDNPHFRNGDPSVAISEVIKGGPAEGKLKVNDRLISANSISLENVDYARAVQILRDSGQSVLLVVKRRIVLPSSPEPQNIKVSLAKNKKKEDYGVILGCRIYVKEIINQSIADKDGSLMEGDVVLKINNTSTDSLSLKEARKLLDGAKDKLHLLVRRESTICAGYSPQLSPDFCSKDNFNTEFCSSKPRYSSQNLYVQPPTRLIPVGESSKNFTYHDLDSKSNLKRYPPNHLNLSSGMSLSMGYDDTNPPLPPLDDHSIPPRPPLPRPEDYFSRNPPSNSAPHPMSSSVGNQSPSKENGTSNINEPRFVSFKKEGSVGIRLTGGNDVGIFVTAVQPKSQAQLQGLIPGDRILKVNEMDMNGVTREEAVLYLMSLQDQIDLIVQTKVPEYQAILSTQKGDLFYIRTHFHYEPTVKVELSFRSGDIFKVVDTLYNGVVGAWQVFRMGRNNQETQKGIIPNKARAEELATAQFNAAKKEQTQSESRSGFFKRRRNSRRSKSLGKDHWEDFVFADSVSKFPAYERVTLRKPGFIRPVVLFGPLADVAREKFLRESPDKFSSPQLDSNIGEKSAGIIRLSAIREILDKGKHALLDITPNAVDRLNYAQFYPIVLFLRADSKQVVKELRARLPKGKMSSKKLYDQSVKLEKLWSHVFTSIISLSQPDTWYKKLKETIDKQQSGPIWMSEAKPSENLNDDFLFPMTSRLSYASSPESDLETGPEPRTPSKSPQRLGLSGHFLSEGGDRDIRNGRLVKSSSDPSIVAPNDGVPLSPLSGVLPNNGPPPYTASHSKTQYPPHANSSFEDRRKSQGNDSKYGFAGGSSTEASDRTYIPPPTGPSCSPSKELRGSPINGSQNGSPGLDLQNDIINSSSVVHMTNSNFSQYTPSFSGPRITNPLTHPQLSPHPPHLPSPGSHSQIPFPFSDNRSLSKNSSNYPHKMSSFPSASPQSTSVYNGHIPPHSTGDLPPPLPVQASKQFELPPKVNRAIKPLRLRISSSQEGTDLSRQKLSLRKEIDFGDSNYINTSRALSSVPSNYNTSLERGNKSPYDTSGLPLGTNSHEDLKGTRGHQRSLDGYNKYGSSLSKGSNYYSEDLSRNDYKPIPPPKSGINCKPMPPPKPKTYRVGVGNGLNGAEISSRGTYGYDRSYHMSNGALSGDDYNGVDSGQGSSLDRKYETLGRIPYSKQQQIIETTNRGGYYLNVASSRDPNAPVHYGGAPPPLPLVGANSRNDLPNHDHRGSAFELYKKPNDPRNAALAFGIGPYGQSIIPQQQQQQQQQQAIPPPTNQMNSYLDHGSR